jgi:hypothetical protein
MSNNSGTAKVRIIKNERDPPLFTGELQIKFQNILKKTTQVIVWHRICLQTDEQTDGRTDGRTWWNQYTPLQLCCGGYNNVRRDGSTGFANMTAYISSTSLCRYISTFSTCALKLSIGNKKTFYYEGALIKSVVCH